MEAMKSRPVALAALWAFSVLGSMAWAANGVTQVGAGVHHSPDGMYGNCARIGPGYASGLNSKRDVAAVAEAADIAWYGGTMLETSIGSAASAQVFCTLGPLHHGCELFGPQLLVDDLVTERMAIRDFELQLPDGPGFGVTVDLAQLDRFDRARSGLNAVHVDLGARATVA